MKKQDFLELRNDLIAFAAIYNKCGETSRKEYRLATRSEYALEELYSDLRACRNELCQQCGNYKLAHKGACDGCRWKDMGD